jgi:hypothetical protein
LGKSRNYLEVDVAVGDINGLQYRDSRMVRGDSLPVWGLVKYTCGKRELMVVPL